MTAQLRLVLVRHAEATVARGDPDLSPLGERQAGLLRDRLRSTGELRGTTRFFSSPLARAAATAAVVAESIGDDGLPVTVMTDLAEMRFGDVPGAETWAQFERRARAALRACLEGVADSTVVVMGHTGIVEVSFIEFAGLVSRAQRFAMQPRNTSITTWVTAGTDLARRTWRLEGYNEASHLWANGAFQHEPEDFEQLESGVEPFWDVVAAEAEG